VIEFRGIGVRYPRSQRDVLRDVGFAVPRGMVTALVGPNGSGKSTLVRALLGRVPLTRGTITIDGSDVRRLQREEVARRVSVVTQREEPVFPLSVRDYVALGRLPHRGPWGRETGVDRAAIDSALERTDVQPLRSRSIDQLSGGEWQRVRFARALAQSGSAIVADEPTTFLDVAHEMAAFELLSRIARDSHAVLLVSHQLNLVARFADRMVLLADGEIAATGTVTEVMRAEVLERVYQWPVVVSRDPATGAPSLIPLRRAASGAPRQTGS
jgi:iron complex transport system ATP-binding protein